MVKLFFYRFQEHHNRKKCTFIYDYIRLLPYRIFSLPRSSYRRTRNIFSSRTLLASPLHICRGLHHGNTIVTVLQHRYFTILREAAVDVFAATLEHVSVRLSRVNALKMHPRWSNLACFLFQMDFSLTSTACPYFSVY